MQPSVGRIVHYYSVHAEEPQAALVVSVPELLSEQPNSGPDGYVRAVNLVVFDANGGFCPKREVPFVNGYSHFWDWPPRV